MIAIIVVVGGAIALRLLNTPSVQISPKTKTEFPNAIDKGSVGTPKSFLGSLFVPSAPTPTPTPGSAIDLTSELKSTVDDGGQADLNALSQEANGL